MSAGGMAEGFKGGSTRSQPLSYSTLSVEGLLEGVRVPAEDGAHLYLWTTNGFLEAAFSVARAWGFRFSTMLVWSKAPMGGGLGGAFGISTEFCLFCRRGKLPTRDRIAGTCFDWKRPYDKRGKPQHSAKPPEFLEVVERISPPPYLEMFSREKEPRIGWSYHGDESLNTAEIAS